MRQIVELANTSLPQHVTCDEHAGFPQAVAFLREAERQLYDRDPNSRTALALTTARFDLMRRVVAPHAHRRRMR